MFLRHGINIHKGIHCRSHHNRRRWSPVSYTHLDVYKRQSLSSTDDDGSGIEGVNEPRDRIEAYLAQDDDDKERNEDVEDKITRERSVTITKSKQSIELIDKYLVGDDVMEMVKTKRSPGHIKKSLLSVPVAKLRK